MIDIQQRSDDRIEARLAEIAGHELPDRVVDLVAAYDRHVGLRDEFLWKWVHALLPHVTFSSVPPEHEETARDAKTVASMFVVLVDDLGERDRDKATLEEVSKIPFEWQSVDEDRPDFDVDVLRVADRIWTRFEDLVAAAPRHEEFSDVLSFDVSQTLTAVDYSFLVNENLEMANQAEHWIYECNNMMLFPYADVDLMFSPGFNREDLSVVRRTVRRSQKMARIGNWVTTWERELHEGDFTSGVVVAALGDELVESEDLSVLQNGATPPDVERVVDAVRDHGIEQDLLDAWGRTHRDARALVSRSNSVDLEQYLDGMETVLQFHLVSRGMK